MQEGPMPPRQSDEMFCHSCAAVVKVGIQYCPKCGTSLGGGPLNSQAMGNQCPHCSAPDQDGAFCRNCGRYRSDSTGTVERVTFTRRFFGDVGLEFLITLVVMGAVPILLNLVLDIPWLGLVGLIGYWILFFVVSRTAQSPAKRALNVYIIDVKSGRAVGSGRVWVRDLLVKGLLFSFAGIFTVYIAPVVNYVWALFDRDRQALHDKICGTVVVYAPKGLPADMQNDFMRRGASPGPAMTAPQEITTNPAPDEEGLTG